MQSNDVLTIKMCLKSFIQLSHMYSMPARSKVSVTRAQASPGVLKRDIELRLTSRWTAALLLGGWETLSSLKPCERPVFPIRQMWTGCPSASGYSESHTLRA